MSEPVIDVVVSPSGRVTRFDIQDGQDYSTTLRWCATHHEPVWVYSDDFYTCPYDHINERVSFDGHAIVDALWEGV